MSIVYTNSLTMMATKCTHLCDNLPNDDDDLDGRKRKPLHKQLLTAQNRLGTTSTTRTRRAMERVRHHHDHHKYQEQQGYDSNCHCPATVLCGALMTAAQYPRGIAVGAYRTICMEGRSQDKSHTEGGRRSFVSFPWYGIDGTTPALTVYYSNSYCPVPVLCGAFMTAAQYDWRIATIGATDAFYIGRGRKGQVGRKVRRRGRLGYGQLCESS